MIESVELEWRFGTIEVPAPDRYIREAIEVTGEYSGDEIDLYQSLVKPGDVALDVGANIGVFSVALGLAVGPSGRVLAFEPQPGIFEILKRNIARHHLPHVQAHRAMLAEAERSSLFPDLRTLPAGKKMNFGGISAELRVRREFGAMVTTPVWTVDGLGLERCSFVKVDVEGAEQAVLTGATATIARCRPVLSIEFDRPNAASLWVDGLLAAGYRLWRYRGTVLREPNPKAADIGNYDNFVCIMVVAIPEERLVDFAGVDLSSCEAVESRASLVQLSRGIMVHRP